MKVIVLLALFIYMLYQLHTHTHTHNFMLSITVRLLLIENLLTVACTFISLLLSIKNESKSFKYKYYFND